MYKDTNIEKMINKKNKFLTITLPLLLWTALMIVVSSTPGDKLPEVDIWGWDKLAHCAEYIVFSFLLFRYFFLVRTFTIENAWRLGVIISIIYAGLDELHQIPIPNRICTWQDFVADICGVGIGVYGGVKYFSRKNGV